MPDLAHVFGTDLQVDDSGTLVVVSGNDWTTQRVLRRLLTNSGDYIWQPDYGGGLRSMVGEAVSAKAIRAVIVDQMALETGVAQDTPPTVIVESQTADYVAATVAYVDASTGILTSMQVGSGS